jgi:uncharacterized protein YqeY
MTLFEKISEDIKNAMKAKEKDKLEAIRAIKAQLLLAKTSEGGSDEISEEQGVLILQKMVKQRKDSAEIYKQQGRTDLYEKEMLEVSYIMPYLPAQMSEAELEAELKKIIVQVGATSVKDIGKVMGLASKQLQGKAEGKLIAEKVKQLLG